MTRTISLLAVVLTFLLAAPRNSPAAPSDPPSPEFERLMREAAAEYQRKDYPAVLQILDRADKLQLDQPFAINLRGAVYTEQKDYIKAQELFERAARLDPSLFAPKFNIGELLFMQKKYPEARAHFEGLLKEDPKNEMVMYKIFLCLLLEGNNDSAKSALDKMPFPSNTPAYYFANAAWSIRRGETKDGFDWIASSGRIFNAQTNDFFIRSFIELGWITRESNGNMTMGGTNSRSTAEPPKP